MRKLIEILQQAQTDRVAVGHFNVADMVLLKAVFQSARALNFPVLVGASESERDFVGTRQLAALVRSLREEFDYPVFLNADHTHSMPKAIEAVKDGFDSVVFDLSSLPLEENVRQTREAVERLKCINPSVLIEGEIGDIGTGSEIHEDAPSPARSLTSASDAQHFVEATHVDILAPAVGNSHGMQKSMLAGEEKKHLDIGRIREIKMATGIPLTLHGGSGTADEDLKAAIDAGINIIHINTELRLAWRRGLEQGLASRKDEIAPYKILPFAVTSVQEVVSSRLRLFVESSRVIGVSP
jgi:fructose-bisphosphate aldolase class II